MYPKQGPHAVSQASVSVDTRSQSIGDMDPKRLKKREQIGKLLVDKFCNKLHINVNSEGALYQ